MIEKIDFQLWNSLADVRDSYRFNTLKTLKIELAGLEYAQKIERLKALGLNPNESFEAAIWVKTDTVELDIKPANDDEVNIYNRWWLDYWREHKFSITKDALSGVVGANALLNHDNRVVPFETLKAKLLNDLSKSDSHAQDEIIERERDYLQGLINNLSNKSKIQVEVALDLICGRKEWGEVNDPYYLTDIAKRLQLEPIYMSPEPSLFFNYLAEVWDLVEYQRFIAKDKKEILPKPVKKLDLQSSLNDKQIKRLYVGLTEREFINSKNTTFQKFKEVFISSVTFHEPIKWVDIKVLVYMFTQMNEKYNFIKNSRWQNVLEKRRVFISKDDKPLKANNLSTVKNKFRDDESSETRYIEDLLKEIKPLN